MIILRKECSEVDPWTGDVKYFTRHLHLQALQQVPDDVLKMAWINRENGGEVVA